jgi:hypothetical protein
MPDNWTPGDVAVCIAREEDWDASVAMKPKPKRNHFYNVTEVVEVGFLWRQRLFLGLREMPSNILYVSSFFRKIDPLSEEEQNKYREELANEREAARFIKQGLPTYNRPKENV